MTAKKCGREPAPGGVGPHADATIRKEDVEDAMWKTLRVLCPELRVRESAVIAGGNGREHIRARHVLWYILSRRFTQYAVSQVCEVHHSTMRRAVERINREIATKGDLAQVVERVVKFVDYLEADTLRKLAELYNSKMRDTIRFEQSKRYTVRQWDGMDMCWSDVAVDKTPLAALEEWDRRTKGGTERFRFDQIDYYAIFPAETKMLYDDSSPMSDDDEERTSP